MAIKLSQAALVVDVNRRSPVRKVVSTLFEDVEETGEAKW